MKQKVKEKMVKTSLRLPAGLWRAARLGAMMEHRDAQDLVAEALRRYLYKSGVVRVWGRTRKIENFLREAVGRRPPKKQRQTVRD
jgi:hypothetical protein